MERRRNGQLSYLFLLFVNVLVTYVYQEIKVKKTFIDSLMKRGDCNSVKVEERKDQVINFESKKFNTRFPLKYDGIKSVTQLS